MKPLARQLGALLADGLEEDVRAQEAAAKADATRRALEGITLERLVSAPEFADLPVSPVQRALCRAADGLPFELDRMRFHVGAELFTCTERPRVVILRTGVRAGKTLIAVLGLLLSVLTCRMRRPPTPEELADGVLPAADGLVGVRPGELVRALIVAPKLRLSKGPLAHLVGTMRRSKLLAPMLVSSTAENAIVRRPDGVEVSIDMVAASTGGTNIRSTWLAGCLLDEADFHDDEDGVVNLAEQVKAARPRLLPGVQLWIVSSPLAEETPFDMMFRAAFGKPGPELAFHSDTRSMNPTLDRATEARERAADPENAAREYDAIPLPTGGSAFFPPSAIAACINHDRSMQLEPEERVPHFGGVDLGFRKNSSAWAFARYQNRRVVLAYTREMVPEKGTPLRPSDVCRALCEDAHAYRCGSVRGDLHYADTAHEEFAKHKNRLNQTVIYDEWAPTTELNTEEFSAFRRLMLEGKLELPNDPRLLKQLRDTKGKAMPGSQVIRIVLPKHGHTHGDVLRAVVHACVQVPTDEGARVAPIVTSDSRWGGSEGRGFG